MKSFLTFTLFGAALLGLYGIREAAEAIQGATQPLTSADRLDTALLFSGVGATLGAVAGAGVWLCWVAIRLAAGAATALDRYNRRH